MKPTHVRCVRTARVAHARRMHSYTRSCDARSWCSGCARELVLCCAQVLTTGFVMGSVHAFRTRTAPSRHPPYRHDTGSARPACSTPALRPPRHGGGVWADQAAYRRRGGQAAYRRRGGAASAPLERAATRRRRLGRSSSAEARRRHRWSARRHGGGVWAGQAACRQRGGAALAPLERAAASGQVRQRGGAASAPLERGATRRRRLGRSEEQCRHRWSKRRRRRGVWKPSPPAPSSQTPASSAHLQPRAPKLQPRALASSSELPSSRLER